MYKIKIKLIYNKLSYIFQAINKLILLEQNNFILWVCPLIMFGAAYYLHLEREPELIYIIYVVVVLAIILWLLRKHKLLYYFFAIIWWFNVGILICQIKANLALAPTVTSEVINAKITGKVENIVPLISGKRLTLSEIAIDKLAKEVTPQKIRLTVKTSLNTAHIGDLITIRANLMPPPLPNLPWSYDFALKAFFEQIGAIGYATSDAKILEQKDRAVWSNKLANFRHKMLRDINSSLREPMGNIAAALMIGEYVAIDQRIIENMRISGISHILSVSGMHLTMVVTICFFCIRFLLVMVYPISNKWDVKKIAAYIALIISWLYLLVSGMQVAAVRSFIMSAMIIMAIIFDRNPNPIRSISVAALIIILFEPENVINPSFQMSFAAVLALISGYQLYLKLIIPSKNNGWLMKIYYFVMSSFFSSLIAGAATAPYAIYHFNQYSNYSILTNLLVVPLTSIIIMPAVILSFMLYPFDAMQLALWPMGLAIEAVIHISDYIASIPYSFIKIKSFSAISLFTMTLGGLWLMLFQTKIRLFGLVLLVTAYMLAYNHQLPDMILDSKSKIYSYIKENKLFISSSKLTKFNKTIWFNSFGQQDILIQDLVKDDGCEYQSGNYQVNFKCNQGKIDGQVMVKYLNEVIDMFEIDPQQTSSYLLYFNKNEYKKQISNINRKCRIWGN